VVLKIYNSRGQEINTLVNEYQNRGEHRIEFEGRSLSSGVYYYRIQMGERKEVKKMIKLK